MSKRYSYDTTGEMVLNPDYEGWAAGRIEIWDSESDSGYPIEEARYFVKYTDEDAFRSFWDNFESDWPIYIGGPISNIECMEKKSYK